MFFNGMNHFPLLKILCLSTSRDSCSSGHPELQNYVLQKPARACGHEHLGGVEDSFKTNLKIKSTILLHSILSYLWVFFWRFLFKYFPKDQQMDADNKTMKIILHIQREALNISQTISLYKVNVFSLQTSNDT